MRFSPSSLCLKQLWFLAPLLAAAAAVVFLGPQPASIFSYNSNYLQKYITGSRFFSGFLMKRNDTYESADDDGSVNKNKEPGPEISFAIPNLHTNAIRALCNANTSERFNPARDVSIPEIHLPAGSTSGMIGGPPPSERPVLVFYAGGVHGPIRPILLHHWENRSDPDVQIHRYLPSNVSYSAMMRKARFCLCPSGYEVASPRMVEGLYSGCVPVLIKEGYVIPFSDVLNWETFAVIVDVRDIPNLKRILMGIKRRDYVRMQRRGIQMRRHFEVNSPPKRYDVFHMILHSIWLRRLNVRLRGDVVPGS